MAGAARTSDIGSVVRRVFREQRRGPALTLNTLREHWPAIVGDDLAGKTRPGRLAGGTLWIEAPDACWSYELQFFRSEILNAVCTFCESSSVKELRFIAGANPGSGGPEAAPPPASDLETPGLAGISLPRFEYQPNIPLVFSSASARTSISSKVL